MVSRFIVVFSRCIIFVVMKMGNWWLSICFGSRKLIIMLIVVYGSNWVRSCYLVLCW